MIFQIDDKLLEWFQDDKLSDLVCCIMDGRHYISCRPALLSTISESVERHASSTQKERFKSYGRLSAPTNLSKYLTTLCLSEFSKQQILALVKRPSMLLLENELNEWPVYQGMAKEYSKDRRYGDYFKLLLLAMTSKPEMTETLVAHSPGGYGQFEQVLRVYDDDSHYAGTLRYKACVLVDRDTKDEKSYDRDKAKLLTFLSGKEFKSLTDNDIWTLDQSSYIWHMWYKRAIENYFPNDRYVAIGSDISKLPEENPERDYVKFDKSIYDKSDLPKLANGMTYSKYESNLKHFVFWGGEISELQLFLLKLVKII